MQAQLSCGGVLKDRWEPILTFPGQPHPQLIHIHTPPTKDKGAPSMDAQASSDTGHTSQHNRPLSNQPNKHSHQPRHLVPSWSTAPTNTPHAANMLQGPEQDGFNKPAG